MAAGTPAKTIRPAVVPLAAAAAFVGLVPVVLFIDRPRVLLYVAAASVLGAVLYALINGIKSSATNSPGPIEYLLGGMSAVYLAALGGIFAFLIYAALYGLAWLARFPAAWLGILAQVVPASVAGTVTAFVTVVTGFFCAGAEIGHLRDQLYPDVAGLESAFYDLIARKRKRLVGCVVVPVLVLGAALLGLVLGLDAGRWIYVLLQVYGVGISAWLWTAGTTFGQSSREVDAIKDLLEAAGFEVTVSPRVGQAAVDPLLVNVDLFAQSAQRALAVQVKTAERTSPAVDWIAASTLQAAARRLDSVNPEIGLTPHKIEPLMVLVGVEADESLRAFSEETGLALVELSKEDWDEIRRAVRLEERQELARRYLGLAAAAGDKVALDGGEAEPGDGPDDDVTGGQE